MALIKNKTLYWTHHGRDKMRFYRLSEGRVKRVIHTPKRIEEGIAEKTIAAMQPASYKSLGGKENWNQEIWVMFHDEKGRRKIISAWRYPGKTKPRSGISMNFLRGEYDEFLKSEKEKDSKKAQSLEKMRKSKWFR